MKSVMRAYNKDWDLADIQFPVGVSVKMDGIRAVNLHGKILSSTFKPIPNIYIRKLLEHSTLHGYDGEIVTHTNNIADPFFVVQSKVMSEDVYTDFWFCVFDSFNSPNEPYIKRLGCISNKFLHGFLAVKTEEELQRFHKSVNDSKSEGTIVRKLDAPYKFGRVTWKEGYVLKLVDWTREEGIIKGFTENSTWRNRIGSIVIHTDKWGSVYLGSGFNHTLSKDFAENPKKYIGRTVTFKYKKERSKLNPSQPIFVGFYD